MFEFDSPDDELRDEEYPEPDASDDNSETIICPGCQADVYEYAEQCPYCGDYLLATSNVWSGRSWWWIVLGLLGIISVIWTFVL